MAMDDMFKLRESDLTVMRQYRATHKRQVLKDLLKQSIITEKTIYPSFGKSIFFEFQFANPYSHDEVFSIDCPDPELRIITDVNEWTQYREAFAQNEDSERVYSRFPVEPDMLLKEGEKWLVEVKHGETISIPFVFLSFNDGAVAQDPRDSIPSRRLARPAIRRRTIPVTLTSENHYGHTLALLQVRVRPRPFAVHRTFRFLQGESELMKTCIRVKTKRSDGAKFVYSPSKEVVCEWKEEQAYGISSNASRTGTAVANANTLFQASTRTTDGTIVQNIYLKYRCQEFPSIGVFYLLIYGDEHHACLEEIWYVAVHSALRRDLHATMGQSSHTELLVKGDVYSRQVAVYSSQPGEVQFMPRKPFHLISGAVNKVECIFRPLSTGVRQVQLNMVDRSSRELICSWVLRATANPPTVTRTYDLALKCNTVKPSYKRIQYSNPWPKARRFYVRSSDPDALKIKSTKLDIGPEGNAFIRLVFMPCSRPCQKDFFIFINNEDDQSEECLLLRVGFKKYLKRQDIMR